MVWFLVSQLLKVVFGFLNFLPSINFYLRKLSIQFGFRDFLEFFLFRIELIESLIFRVNNHWLLWGFRNLFRLRLFNSYLSSLFNFLIRLLWSLRLYFHYLWLRFLNLWLFLLIFRLYCCIDVFLKQFKSSLKVSVFLRVQSPHGISKMMLYQMIILEIFIFRICFDLFVSLCFFNFNLIILWFFISTSFEIFLRIILLV